MPKLLGKRRFKFNHKSIEVGLMGASRRSRELEPWPALFDYRIRASKFRLR